MSKASDAGRVILDETAKSALERMLVELKADEEYLRISFSKLASRIIERYAEQGFERDKRLFIQQHFNPKEYLRKTIGSLGSDQEIAQALETALQRIRQDEKTLSPRTRKHRPVASEEATLKPMNQSTEERS